MNKAGKPQVDQLDPRSLTAVLILGIVEYEVFTFSKTTVAVAKQDAWLGVLLGALIGTAVVYLLIRLAARFPGKDFFEYLKIVWGKPMGTAFAMVYLLYFLLFLIALFYESTMANQLLFLPRTPKIIPLLIFALALIWLVADGITPIVRFFQLMLPFLLIPLLVLVILFIRSIDYENFLPVLGGGAVPVLKGAFYFLGAYQGPEILLFLAPFITRVKEGTKYAMIGYAIPSFIGWSNTVAALGILGVSGVKEAILPGIDVVTLIELPGFPVERFGLLLTLPWLIAIFTTLAIYLFLLCYGFARLFGLQYKKTTIGILTMGILLTSYFLPNVAWHEKLRIGLTLITPVLVYVLPLVTLFLAIIRKKGEGRNE
ncbi:MAG TPA: endospore germination permease [Bacillota bacterium]|nr:endospore germination permease [Bacillota bacterium]